MDLQKRSTPPNLVTLLELAANSGSHHAPGPSPFCWFNFRGMRERFKETLDRLAAAEESAFAAEFLAPMLRGGVVQVRIAGVVCRFKLDVADFEGWGVFRPIRHRRRAGASGPAGRATAVS